ncbi:MAG: hypothetical protein ABJO01_01400 [Parasphingorhabdus sp.]|uniref:hypothetical protein n=1 Tax=Parasphingorhabdus sp. TaxID=2709688 RepID=UPI003296ACC0
MGWAEAVVAIIIVVTIGKVMTSKYRAQNGILEDEDGNAITVAPSTDPDAGRLREEVKFLKERVAVLEKIATDDRGARELGNEIEKLRDS